MGKKILINTLYNIGIFLSAMSAYWAYTNKQYAIIAAAVSVGAIFIFLKVKLLKEVKATIKQK